jgi:hypothetical protein
MRYLIVSILFAVRLQGMAQQLSIQVGGIYNTTLQKEIPVNPNLNLGGFEPDYGYQVSLYYKHAVFKKMYIGSELGWMQKGHQATDILNPYRIQYHHIYLRPVMGYDFPFGFSTEIGLSVGRYIETKTPIWGDISKIETAFSPALRWQYQKIGFQLGYHRSIQPVQKLDLLGQQIHNRHQAFSLGVSYRF